MDKKIVQQFSNDMIRLVFLIFFILPISVFSQNIKVKRGLDIDTLYFDVQYSHKISEEDEHQINEMIMRVEKVFNHTGHDFKILYVDEVYDVNHITIYVDSLIVSNRQKKILATVGSVFGAVVVPVFLAGVGSPILVGFWYTAPSKNFIQVEISDNLKAKPKHSNRHFLILENNSGWSKIHEENVRKNYLYLETGLMNIFKKLDKRLK